MYSYQTRIRYSELNEKGYLKLEALLDHFQDCSTFHSEDLGFGVEYLMKNHIIWVMSSWQIVVDRYPGLGERVTIATAPYDFKGFIGYRNFWVLDEAGERIACANSIWTLLDTQSARPVKPNEDILKAYELAPMLEMNYAPRRIALPDALKNGEAVQIKKHHLDTNHHVNNGQHVRIAMDSLNKDCKVRQLRAEYKKQVVLGDTLTPWIAETEDDRSIVVLKDQADNICCIVELQEEKE